MNLKNNFYYSSVLTTAGYVFPLITYPYVSRVLGVTNIGICNFVDSIINYFVLFSMMGIRTLGIREIAKCQADKSEMSKTFFSILLLNLLFVFISVSVLLVSIHLVPQFAEQRKLMYIGVVKLIANFFLIDWFYRGIEDFRYITIRSLIIRCVYVVSVFAFVRNKDDYYIYYAILALTVFVNAVVNCIYARNILSFKLQKIQPFAFLKPSLTLGIYTLLTSMYTSFNVAYLGFVTNNTEVGYYTTATKLHHIILAFFTAFTGVMLPRMSHLLSEGKVEEFKRKIDQSMRLLVYFSFPLIVIFACFASVIISIISGPGYEKAALPTMIVLPLVFVIGFEQILVVQVLTPQKGKDNAILINSIVGASIGLLSNILLVENYGCVGSAIVWLLSELSVMLSAMFFVRKTISFETFSKHVLKNLMYAIPAIAFCLFLKRFISFAYLAFFISMILVFSYYGILYFCVIKDKFLISLIPSLKNNHYNR